MLKDSKGNPLVVYHGSPHDFEHFENRGGTVATTFGTVQVAREGFFFTPDRDFAAEFGKVRAFHLALENPLDLREGFPDDAIEQLAAIGVNSRWLMWINPDETWEAFDEPNGKFLVEKLREAGYDGAILKERTGDLEATTWRYATTYVALDPKQIIPVTRHHTMTSTKVYFNYEGLALGTIDNYSGDYYASAILHVVDPAAVVGKTCDQLQEEFREERDRRFRERMANRLNANPDVPAEPDTAPTPRKPTL